MILWRNNLNRIFLSGDFVPMDIYTFRFKNPLKCKEYEISLEAQQCGCQFLFELELDCQDFDIPMGAYFVTIFGENINHTQSVMVNSEIKNCINCHVSL